MAGEPYLRTMRQSAIRLALSPHGAALIVDCVRRLRRLSTACKCAELSSDPAELLGRPGRLCAGPLIFRALP